MKSEKALNFPAKTCQQCQYFDTLTNIQAGVATTICRLNPPRAFAQVGMDPSSRQMTWVTTAAWTVVSATDWCGQWSPVLAS